MATIYDVAHAAGVSISTVSRVLNGTCSVSDGARDQVLKAVETLAYHPSSLARAMVRRETRTIALIVPDIVNAFFAELGRGIEDHGFRQGYNVILCNSDHDRAKEQAYLDMLVCKRVDGLIYMTEHLETAQLQPLAGHNIPIVVFDREYEGFDAVLQDNFGGGNLAARHLISLGHRRIACIGGRDRLRSWDRVRAYELALADAGIPADPAWVLQGDWTCESGHAAARRLLQLHRPPTAIFACNDAMAMGVMSCLYENGLRVPEDLSVVGYDGISWSGVTCPPLTTVATSISMIGQSLCQLLLDRINDELPAEPQRQVIHGSLLVRGSTGAPRRELSPV